MKNLLTRFVAVMTLVAGVAMFGPARPVRLAAAPPLDFTIVAPTTFLVADGLDGSTDGTLNADNLTIASGGSITCNDTGGGTSACPITIVVGNRMVMEAGSKITADQSIFGGGNAGNITITVGTDMTMCGPNGGQTGCASNAGGSGALISATRTDSNAPSAINTVSITVGNTATATGTFYMEGGSTTYGTETGAKIITDSRAGKSGTIAITAGKTYFTEPGSVLQSGFQTGTATQIGGKIYIVADCGLTTEGRITSKGPDPGADLVHLESCEVIIRGLVESTGVGHATAAKNNCDNINDGLPGEVLRDHAAEATGCIEVWGKVITIDSSSLNPATGLPWAGELNADIGNNGGSEGTAWIDIFAYSKLTVIDDTGNDFVRDNGASDYLSTYAVHANSIIGSDHNPGVVTAKVKSGPLTASGKAFEASSTMTGGQGSAPGNDPFDSDTGHGAGPYFVGNGSDGGTIYVEASGAVTLENAWLNASGDFFGGTPCPSGTGACGAGGHIVVSAWGAGSNLSWQNGSGDVRNNDDSADPPPPAILGGTIALNAGGTITTGADFHSEVPTQTNTSDGGKPEIPVITADNGGPVFKTDLWLICTRSTISGIKFSDLNGNGVNDGEPGLGGWVIHLYGTDVNNNAVHLTQTTAAVSGAYTFAGVPAGVYAVCEQLQAASPAWQQTFPASGANCLTAVDPASDNPAPGKWGYIVDLTTGNCCTGQEITGKNFGNWQPPTLTCQKPTAIAIMNNAFPLNIGPDITVKTWLGESVQAAVDNATDLNGDHFVIIMVIARADGSLGGTANQKVAVSKDYTAAPESNYPFGLIGCSVTLTGGGAGPAVWIKDTAKGKQTTINGRPATILVADLHGGNSGVGVEADGTLRYLRNEAATSNGTGIKVLGSNNTVHNGSANGNAGDGVYVSGNGNYLTDTQSMGNSGHGFNVAGNSNLLLKLKTGEKNTPNTLDGVHVVGNSNNLSEIDAYNNSGDGIDVAGTGNTLSKNVAGDKGKGNKGIGILVSGGSSLIENKAIGNLGDGFRLLTSGFSLSKNVSGGTSSGQPNGGCQYRFAVMGNVNAGSNKSKNVTLTGTPFPAGCK